MGRRGQQVHNRLITGLPDDVSHEECRQKLEKCPRRAKERGQEVHNMEERSKGFPVLCHMRGLSKNFKKCPAGGIKLGRGTEDA